MSAMSFRFGLLFGLLIVPLSLLSAQAVEEKHTIEYLDEKTEPGTIAPAEPQPSAQPYRPEGTASPVAASPTAVGGDVLDAFREAYNRAGKPRMVVFVNRDFSDDVRDWGSDVRLKEGYVESRVTDQGRVTGAGTAITTVETRNDGDRRPRDEQWMWRLENAVCDPLLETGTNLIDRAMAMRLTATTAAPDALGEVSVKQVETNALKGHADILIEVLVSNAKDAKFGYVFTVKGTSVKDGRILVRESSASWPANKRSRARGELQVDSEGQVVNADLPNPELMGTWVTEDLLRGLTKSL